MTKLMYELSSLELKVLQCQLIKMSYVEISLLLNKKVKSVDNTMQRIRKKLHKIVEEIKERGEHFE
jgi:DNA-directed RNA polymerase specialized sigma24 family protein